MCPLDEGQIGLHALSIAMAFAIKGSLSIGKNNGEGSVSNVVNTFISEVFDNYAFQHGIEVSYDEDLVCSLPTTTKNDNSQEEQDYQTRRDSIYYINNVPFFIEEVKNYALDQTLANKQLKDNVGAMSEQFYGKVPFVIACSVGGHIVKILCYLRKGNSISASFKNLNKS